MMKIRYMKRFTDPVIAFSFAVLLLMISGCERITQDVDTQTFLKEHILWLSDEERAGRLAGTQFEADASNYIEDLFLQFGLIPFGDEGTYLQHFRLSGPMPQALGVENYLSRNVAGYVEGTENANQYVIVGAHFDGQGDGGLISMDHDADPEIHNSADDNASGTAGLLWLAKEFASNPPEKSVIFVAFSGEELGLLGSRYFAENMQVEKDSVLAMINLDMIGRLDGRDLSIFGTGTSPQWDSILQNIEQDSLSIIPTESGTGASDHASFHDIQIPVLHYFSGTHSEYHRAGDTAELIDYSGMESILEHVEQVIQEVATRDADEIEFSETASQGISSMPGNGVSLGVVPDYSYSGEGFRISSVRSGGVADRSGLQDGDIITEMEGIPINDIYNYMESLGEFEAGRSIVIKVRRSGEGIELNVTF